MTRARVRTFRLVLEYDGTDFAGWQAQRDRRTVQGELEAAIARVTGESARVVGAGRTDAGVHAEGQAASVRLATRLGAAELQRALNAVLPGDLAVIRLARAPDAFHARRDALGKRYRYVIWNGRVRSPLRARRSWWVPEALDLGAMREAGRHLVGELDFASFRSSGSSVRTSVRRVDALGIRGPARGEIRVEIQGSGFLRYMVRAMVGTLVEVGRGAREAATLPEVVAAADRARAGPTAPARGLTLVRVLYPPAGKAAVGRGVGASAP